jgi:putative endonuclease
MYWVYILQSRRYGRYYIGATSDIMERLANHNRGSSTATKPYRPWELVYQESFDNRTAALRRERQIKRFKHGEAFKRLVNKSN